MADLPEKIGKYKILNVAGSGNMGVVYLGHDPFVDRNVAIKVCTATEDDASAVRAAARRTFFREAQTAGSLDHPNILRVYDAGEAEGEPYIVMEYVEGAATLKDHCTPDTLLPIERVIEIMCKCADALDYAHRRGIIHRDIKPANLMVTRGGEPKIVDFGIAQQTSVDQTQLLGVLGSPRYMSPEQTRDETLNNQSDLFSLGVVMYELLTGEPAFNADSVSALLYKILHEEPPPIEEIRPEVPAALVAVVARALDKDRGKRYESGAEIAADLVAVFEPAVADDPGELSDDEKFELVRKLWFFNDFSDAELHEVLAVSDWELHAAGKNIVSEGEVERCFYVIVSGDVALTIGGKTIDSLGRGDCIGEMGYLSKTKRTASALAKSTVSLIRVSEPLTEWASIPCQMRCNKAFTQTLIDRLARTSAVLAEYVE